LIDFRKMPEDAARALRSRVGSSFQSWWISNRVFELRRTLSYLGHSQRTVLKDINRWRQSTRFVCEIFAKWQIHFGSHARQHAKIVGLFERKMLENVHWSQKRAVLHFRQLLSYWWQSKEINFYIIISLFINLLMFTVDRVGKRRQHGLHLELTEQRNRPALARTHWHSFMYSVSSYRKYHRFSGTWKRQNHKIVEERHLKLRFILICNNIFRWFDLRINFLKLFQHTHKLWWMNMNFNKIINEQD
jgi:hypothetical protein